MKNYLKRLCVCLSFVFFLVSCVTVREDVFYAPELMNEEKLKTLDEIELSIVKNYLTLSEGEVILAQKDLKQLSAKPSSDAAYLARVHALYADTFLLSRDKRQAEAQLKNALVFNASDEYGLLVQSRLMHKPLDRKAFLEPLVQTNSKLYRLRCELGSVYTALEQYTEAVVAFDASLPFLPPVYSKLYGSQRSLSFTRTRIKEPLDSKTQLLVSKTEISLEDMTALTQENTSAVDYITGGANLKTPVLAERLKNAGWYASDTEDLNALAQRQDVALFLWNLLNIRDTKQLQRYTKYYKNKNTSPIPDMPLDSPYFDATLGIVEADIIPLADGIHFKPKDKVSGLEFYGWLKNADRLRN